MEKVFITFTDNGTNKIAVEGIHNPNYLDPAQKESGIEIDRELLPIPEYKPRKNPVLYIDPSTNNLWYEYIDRELTSKEQLEEVQTRLQDAEQAVIELSTIIGGMLNVQ